MDKTDILWYNEKQSQGERSPSMNEITYVGRHTTVYTVARHAHESWEYVYCTQGGGTFFFGDTQLSYKQGDVVIIPPMIPHSNASEQGFNNIHINMDAPILTLKEPTVIVDDSNHFLLNAFNAAFYHYYSESNERAALLSCYGNLISYYLIAYQTGRPRSSVVDEIEHHIISHYADCDYKLDQYLNSLPFSSDYLRKLFQKDFGVTPHQYLTNKRLQIAAEALANVGVSGNSVADIALMCGFREPLYFSKMFKKKYGVAPSYYVKTRHAAQDERPDPDSVKLMLEEDE